MKIKIGVKLAALIFCIVGTICLNIQNMSWVYDLLSIGLGAYSLILCVSLIVLALEGGLDVTLDWIFMSIGSVLNIAGGLTAIIFYFKEDTTDQSITIPRKFLIPIGVCAAIAGSCMMADFIRGVSKHKPENIDD